ncbi:hypothetical protein RRG08_018232 [Elysia crispata]|uniref:Uncharacterized protein n=1 Tax=Elysia crispata TaxID=231223 RepID=A0AAE0YK60_9GAST|nr:hypothetical protein RRG08_018232 [Elysia crispata]
MRKGSSSDPQLRSSTSTSECALQLQSLQSAGRVSSPESIDDNAPLPHSANFSLSQSETASQPSSPPPPPPPETDWLLPLPEVD